LLRKARAGHVTGGRVYGYTNVEVTAQGPDDRPRVAVRHRELHPEQAPIVRRLFTLCAEGWGFTRIAKQLNAEGVPPPRPGAAGWAPAGGPR